MRLLLPGVKYPTADARRLFYEQFESRLGALPGVNAAAITTAVPPTNNEEWRLDIEGRSVDPPPSVSVIRIGARFFDVLDRTLLRGRGFEPADAAPAALGVIINERLVRQLFSGEDPIGRRVRFIQRDVRRSDRPGPWRTIVGISPDIRPQHAGGRRDTTRSFTCRTRLSRHRAHGYSCAVSFRPAPCSPKSGAWFKPSTGINRSTASRPSRIS